MDSVSAVQLLYVPIKHSLLSAYICTYDLRTLAFLVEHTYIYEADITSHVVTGGVNMEHFQCPGKSQKSQKEHA